MIANFSICLFSLISSNLTLFEVEDAAEVIRAAANTDINTIFGAVINENLKAFIAQFQGETKENGSKKFECHNKNIDIQYCISGSETFGWKPRQDCSNVKEAYSDEKDVLFFNEKPDMYFTLHSGQFVVFFPEDVHAPSISDGEIKKLVIKVKI